MHTLMHMRSARHFMLHKRQHGAVAIIFGLAILVVIGMMGLALDLAQIYNRKTELQNIADGAALVAAKELNGTADGITSAVAHAKSLILANKYNYTQAIDLAQWSASAIEFSTDPDAAAANWVSAGLAMGAPADYLFVKVDTDALDVSLEQVSTMFMGVLNSALASSTTSARAVAGRTSIQAMPLAVCALRPNFPTDALPHAGLPNELREFGFRRGVSYNLLNLNPYVINPIDRSTGICHPENMLAAAIRPFVCTGTMPMTRLTASASTVYVSNNFPVTTIELNSRFNSYAGNTCSPVTAPPDANITPFAVGIPAPGARWMNTRLTAAQTISSAIAQATGDSDAAPRNGNNYGPLWAYAKAVQASLPHAPYDASATIWAALYPATSNVPAPVIQANRLPPSYPATRTPYRGLYFLAPPSNGPGLWERRVLNVPLLNCTILPAGPCQAATVLGIGQFFMTVPATGTSISGEFAGAITEQAALASAPVRLYR